MYTTRDIAEMLEQSFNSVLLCQYIVEQDLSKLTDNITEKLNEEGFPEKADYLNTNWTIDCNSTISFEDWAEMAVNSYLPELDKETVATFFNSDGEMRMYYDNLENINIIVTINDDLEVWKMENEEVELDMNVVASQLSNHWEQDRETIIAKLLEDIPDFVKQDYKEKLDEEGFPVEANIDNTKFKLDIKNNVDFTSWAEMAVNNYLVTSISHFIQSGDVNRMYMDHIQYFTINITCLDNVEEWR